MKLYKVKSGALKKTVPDPKWYLEAGWVIVNETNTKKTSSKRSKVQKEITE